jgi:hypothetical protein
MVARVIPNAAPLISRQRGLAIGLVAAALPAGLALAVFLGSSPRFGLTLAIACLGSGSVIGATIGRSLAAKPDPLGVLIVSGIAVAVGDVFAAPILAIETPVSDPLGFLLGGLIIVGIPAYFFLAFPGLVIGILLARRMTSGS